MSSLGLFSGKYRRRNFIFVGKRNTIFTEHTENIIFPCMFWERSSLIFRPWKNYHTVFSEKKCHLCWWYKKDHIPVQFFWKDRLFRIFEEYISFPCVFFGERSSFFCGLKNKIKFSRKRNITFAGDTRKIITSAVFLTRPYFQNIWKKKIWFFMQWKLLQTLTNEAIRAQVWVISS